MQRLKQNDRGATAVIVAVVITALLSMGAIAIDVSAMHAEKQQLQTGADAAALAIAQDCARDACGDPAVTADYMAQQNKNDGDAEASFVDPSSGSEVGPPSELTGNVTVRIDSIREHWFAPIIGINETPIAAQASAQWGYPVGGTAVMPLVLSWCELVVQAGVSEIRDQEGEIVGLDFDSVAPEAHTIFMTKSSRSDCTGPSNLMLPGGFGWVAPDGAVCTEVTTAVGDLVGSDPGNSPPSVCQPIDFTEWIGHTVLLPVFDAVHNADSYEIFGYAAFTLTGYYFAGQFSYPANAGPCKGEQRCIRGTFDRFVDLSDSFQYSTDGPRLGAAVVALTQ